MNMRTVLWMALFVCLLDAAYAAKPRTAKEWEQCRDKAEESVNQMEVGIAGVEYEIKKRCGAPPAKEPSSATGAVGMQPSDVVRSKAWRDKFKAITKARYPAFVERLSVASKTQLEGDWIVGEGIAPHSGGVEEAAMAINAKSGEVLGAMLEDGKKTTRFGADGTWQNAPAFLKDWVAAREQ